MQLVFNKKTESYVHLDEVEKSAKATWESEPKIRSEFLEYSTYLSFKKAEAHGLIGICGSRSE